MRVTIVGCGDAFGSGGRAHTAFRLDEGGSTLLVDFGASALGGWKALGLDTDDIDAVVVSHLHGDHFGGLPFLLLECQFVARRTKPLVFLGPPQLRQRLETVLEAFFPGSLAIPWSFDWRVREFAPGEAVERLGFKCEAFPVDHPSGSVSTGLRVAAGGRVFAFSGDTHWTETLVAIARDADLFAVECFSGACAVAGHMDWPTLRAGLPRLAAKRVVVTHLGPSALPVRPQMETAGLFVADDGRIFDL